MYYPDLSPYSYLGPDSDGSLNVGWLDAEHPFPRGSVPPHLLERILALCFKAVNYCMGYHTSPFDPSTIVGYSVEHKGNQMSLGNGEIRVPSKSGVMYAAPTLIYHYIKDCGYLPPQDFLDALEEMTDPV